MGGPRCGRAQSSRKAVSVVEARIVSLGAVAKPEQCAGESDSLARIWHQRGAVAELETRRQKETGGLECRTLLLLRASAVCSGEGGSRCGETGWH